MPGVKGYHHFCFSKDPPGWVYCKRYADSEEVEFDLLKDQTKLPSYTLPPVIKPLGMDLERKNYLYKEIRQFCKPDSANLVAKTLMRWKEFESMNAVVICPAARKGLE